MADRIVESTSSEVPEIPALLENLLVFTLDEAKQKMEKGEEVVPFTTLLVKGNLFLETHPGDTPEECFSVARHTVEGARGAEAYAFCYDGYIETDDGVKDALIAEGGLPGDATGHAVGYLYDITTDQTPVFEPDPAYVGAAPNFMIELKPAGEYDESEIDEIYLDEDDAEEQA